MSARCAVCGRAFANRAHSPAQRGAHEFTAQLTEASPATSVGEGGQEETGP